MIAFMQTVLSLLPDHCFVRTMGNRSGPFGKSWKSGRPGKSGKSSKSTRSGTARTYLPQKMDGVQRPKSHSGKLLPGTRRHTQRSLCKTTMLMPTRRCRSKTSMETLMAMHGRKLLELKAAKEQEVQAEILTNLKFRGQTAKKLEDAAFGGVTFLLFLDHNATCAICFSCSSRCIWLRGAHIELVAGYDAFF